MTPRLKELNRYLTHCSRLCCHDNKSKNKRATAMFKTVPLGICAKWKFYQSSLHFVATKEHTRVLSRQWRVLGIVKTRQRDRLTNMLTRVFDFLCLPLLQLLFAYSNSRICLQQMQNSAVQIAMTATFDLTLPHTYVNSYKCKYLCEESSNFGEFE